MPDDITYTSTSPAGVPSSTKQATDEHATRGHMPIVKLAYSADGIATHVTADADGLQVNLGTNNDVTLATLPDTTGGDLAAIKTAVQIIDNFISGSKGLVTEDNSASILTAVQTIDNFISGSRGLVTEDNSAAMLTALQVIDNFISGSRGLVTEDNSANALTALQLIDDVIVTLGTTTYTEATTKGAVIGAVRRDADTTLVDTTNEIGPLQMNALGQLKVEVFSGETLPVSVSGASTLAEQQTQTTALQLIDDTVFAEDVAAQAADKGVAILAVRRDADTSLVGADNDYANLQVDANGYLKVEVFDGGGSHTVDNAGTFATQATLQAGTAAVGKLLPPDVDVTTHTNYIKKYYTNAGAVTDGIIWSPAAGKRFHVVSMYLNVSAAATVTLEDDLAGGDSAIWKGEYAANSGVTIYFGEKYPLASGEDAADLIITTSAGNVYFTCTGYEV